MSEFTEVATAEEIVDWMLTDIVGELAATANGQLMSGYFSFLEDESGNCISMSITKETNRLEPNEYFYSLHLIDEITGKDCGLFLTDDLTKEGLLELVSSLIKNTMEELKCITMDG